MTLDEVAKKMHISNKTLINWEKGYVNPSWASLNTLAELYNMPLKYISLPTKSTKSEVKK